jgi:hypothetical protein
MGSILSRKKPSDKAGTVHSVQLIDRRPAGLDVGIDMSRHDRPVPAHAASVGLPFIFIHH